MTINKTLVAIATAAMLISSAANADGYWRYGHRYDHRGNWVAPAIGGLIIGGVIAGSIADQPEYYDRVCQRVAVYDQWNRFLGYRTVCQ